MSMVGPKVHGVEDHLLELMVKYKGIGCFVKDFIEQAHQTGVKEEKRTKEMRNKFKEALAHLSWEARSNDIGVEDAMIAMQQRTKRKRRQDVAEDERKSESKIRRDELRDLALEAVERGDFDMEIMDMKKRIDNG